MIIFNLITLKEYKQDISDFLKQNEFIKMFSFLTVDEHSDQQNADSSMSKKDLVVGYTEKIKLEVLIENEKLRDIIKILTEVKGLGENSYSWTTEIDNLRFFKKFEKEINNEI